MQNQDDADEGMSKFGVDESVDAKVMEKAAAEGCPECGAKVRKEGSILICPTHGTEPFEKAKQEHGSQKEKAGT